MMLSIKSQRFHLLCLLAIGSGIASFYDIAFFDTETTTGEVIGRMSGDTILIQDALGEKLTHVERSVPPEVHSIPLNICWRLHNRIHKGMASVDSLGFLHTCPCTAGGSMALIMSKMSSRGQVAYAEAGNVVEQTIGAIRTVAAFTGEKLAINKSLGQTTPSLNAFAAGQAAAYKMFETINRKPLIDTSDTQAGLCWKTSGEIELKDVYFSRRSTPGWCKFEEISNSKWLRQQMGLVSQEPILFATTIKENISYGKENATEDEIKSAIELANAAKFLYKLPQQRLAIARAILKNPRILLLDEATSALDAESERIVQEALDKVMANRTTVVVAHRLTTIRNADLIAVVNAGKLLEQGTHAELINDPNGAYSQLVRMQGGNREDENMKKYGP
ncbi:hypothetical protein HAX54_037887 [Datura stramonium]|uniref:ABC transporter domain-containing protein n=1 Tax=Datura stramonium TaxID=4076 RepID=A0ABS8VLU9_DATST|nr:hypothetical protein [Datura stramonium]